MVFRDDLQHRAQAVQRQPILVRADSAGASHGLVHHLCGLGVRFSVGFDLDSRVRTAILALPADAWLAAIAAAGGDRDRAQVAELPTLDLPAAGWPAGTRAICRRERPSPAHTDRHRRRRMALPGLHHRPARPRPCQPGVAPPPACPGRGPHPRRQGNRRPQPAIRPWRRNAICSSSCCSPSTWSAGRKPYCWTAPWPSPNPRPWLPAVARRRSHQPPRPPAPVAAAAHLAVGGRPGPRVHPPGRPAAVLLNHTPHRPFTPALPVSLGRPLPSTCRRSCRSRPPTRARRSTERDLRPIPGGIPGRQQTNLPDL